MAALQACAKRSRPRRVALWAAALALCASAGSAFAQEVCSGIVSAACLERLGAGAIDADAACRRQWLDYRDCLADRAEAVGAPAEIPTAGAGCSEARAQALWADARAANDCRVFESFRAACPETPEAAFALGLMSRLGCDPLEAGTQEADARAAKAAVESAGDDASACRMLPRFSRDPLVVKVGDRLCELGDRNRYIEVTGVQRGGVTYVNGPRGRVACKVGELCGVHWRVGFGFRVDTTDMEPGSALLLPLGATR